MSGVKIKVCGIKDSKLAQQAVQLGADWIGVMCCMSSIRYVNPSIARLIALSCKAAGAETVAVFTDHCAEQMLALCELTGITIVQLHGEQSRQQHHILPKEIVRVYVLHVDQAGQVVNKDDPYIKLLDPKRDYLLFDGLVGGSGQRIVTDQLPAIAKGFRFLVAGGIDSNNISDVIQQCSPDGIDVSSGVEDGSGEKSLALIQQLLGRVGGGEVIDERC